MMNIVSEGVHTFCILGHTIEHFSVNIFTGPGNGSKSFTSNFSGIIRDILWLMLVINPRRMLRRVTVLGLSVRPSAH